MDKKEKRAFLFSAFSVRSYWWVLDGAVDDGGGGGGGGGVAGFLITKTSSIFTFDSFFARPACSFSVPGTNSDEYLNGRLLLICCLFDDALVDCFDDTSTRRMVSSLVVDDDVDDEVSVDSVEELPEWLRCFFDEADFWS